MNWRDFWNGEHAVYVSERHKILHDRMIARDIVAVMDELATPRDAIVLDHGCGEARSAEMVARRCASLFLCDGAPNVRDKLKLRFGQVPAISVLTPEDVPSLPDDSLDLVVVNSLLQYLPQAELTALLAVWHTKLKPGGHLVLGDVIAPGTGALTDVRALLGFAWQGGFLTAALVGLARTALSDYRRLRQELGLTTHEPADMLARLRAAGFDARRHPRNLGHNQARMTFIGRKIASA
jgi:SAM-dependent methyltransferase